MNINVARCIKYLQFIGVALTEEEAQGWAMQERNDRARRRSHNRELQRSCGHFRTHSTRIVHDGGTIDVTTCSDCHRYVVYSGASL